ncbi:DUF2827 family protein [Paraburkholderia sp. FT54]|uniref:DUF2827 family protein n=1 Tax=Paraburkholderia sp. FT54 TaxID=3074437 RepID=UPI002877CFA9|nr:DUF2827 family protein [Paraburkholderia sp. FT54]WNC92666.1 DUF2827 family protein [Paraburkholderia sp. FT54]
MHNATLCADLGYYYRDNDATQGAQQVLAALDTHDAQASSYRVRQRALIGRFSPNDPQLVAAYSALLDDLMRRPIR